MGKKARREKFLKSGCEYIGLGLIMIIVGSTFLIPSAITYHDSTLFSLTNCTTTGYNILPQRCEYEVSYPWSGYITFRYQIKNNTINNQIKIICGDYKKTTLENLKKSRYGKIGETWKIGNWKNLKK